MVNKGRGADITPPWKRKYRSINPPGYATLNWNNWCDRRYGSYEDLIPIMNVLEKVTTVPGFMPLQYQNSKCAYNVFRDMGPGAARLHVGNGLIDGTPDGNEVE